MPTAPADLMGFQVRAQVVSDGSFFLRNDFSFRLPRACGRAPTGCSVAAQQTEGVFEAVFACETIKKRSKTPSTSLRSAPLPQARRRRKKLVCVEKRAVRHGLVAGPGFVEEVAVFVEDFAVGGDGAAGVVVGWAEIADHVPVQCGFVE